MILTTIMKMMQSKDASLPSVLVAGVPSVLLHQNLPTSRATRMSDARQRSLPVLAGLHIMSANASNAVHSHAFIIMLALTCWRSQEMDGQV